MAEVFGTWRCELCGSVEDRGPGDVSGVPPLCGRLSRDRSDFPDGGWVLVETWIPHPPMVFVGVTDPLVVNPLADLVEKRELAEAAEASSGGGVGE